MKQVVLVSWKPDADEVAIKEFLEIAPGALAKFPFLSLEHGTGRKVAAGSADWGFIGELAEEGDLDTWLHSDAHGELLAAIMPIKGDVSSFQL